MFLQKMLMFRWSIPLIRKINNTVALALDKITKYYITSLKNPMLWDINVAIYTVAITARQYNNYLKEIPAEKTKLNNMGGLRNIKLTL